MGLSALVIVVREGCSVATSSLEAWRDLIKSTSAVIGRRPRLLAMHDLYIASSTRVPTERSLARQWVFAIAHRMPV
jgi:hypothetical protein